MPPRPSFSMISYTLSITAPGARSLAGFTRVFVREGLGVRAPPSDVAQLLQNRAVSVFSALHLGQVLAKPDSPYLAGPKVIKGLSGKSNPPPNSPA